ncbi:MAG TPA: FAD-dependent oxidoreductase [Gammaproteobacteria bacterium]|nr:FAD-dependent oxidoreductase [Gammaproteobacteria bacterium]
MAEQAKPTGPDFSAGISIDELTDGGTLAGHVGDDKVMLVRHGDEVFATGTVCTHYHGPLEKGLVVGDTVRCPWHHACFSLRNGEVLGAPALNPIPCWRVDRQGGEIFVRDKLPLAKRSARQKPAGAREPESIVIIGGGAAGEAAATMLRFCGYAGPVTMVSAEDNLPSDRPNLSKDYLAGTAPEAWVPVRSEKHYREHNIELRLNTGVAAIEPAQKRVRFGNGEELAYGALLLATGAEPVRLPIAGADLPHVHYLRTLDDSRAIIAAVNEGAKHAVVIGGSFIGLEVAASLRTRGLEVHVVAPEARPLERVFGPALGDFVRNLHESKGVVFHLGRTASAIQPGSVTLDDGSLLETDLVVVGVGVRPRIALAEAAGLAIDRGVSVNEYLQTSAPDIYAAGDIARWPDAFSGSAIRVEHWVVAQRQGQTAARNMLGYRERYTSPPFFWSQHYDVSLNYVGHADRWDEALLNGDPAAYDCTVTYLSAGRALATATIFRDRESLEVEAEMEREASR